MSTFEPVRRRPASSSRLVAHADTETQRADGPTIGSVAHASATALPRANVLAPIAILPPVALPAESAAPAGADAGDVVALDAPSGHAAERIVGRTMKVTGGAWPLPAAPGGPPIQRKNVTGLPDVLKTGVEVLSGIALDDVRVRYNALEPAVIGALAYARGNKIYVGPGQERHLPHEAWHVVQQKQGRVAPTLMAKGMPLNADAGLEREASEMGARGLRADRDRGGHEPGLPALAPGSQPSLAAPAGAVIQPLMSLADFKQSSTSDYTVRYFSAVNTIDTALSAYHALPKDNFLGRERQLHVLDDACDDYLTSTAATDVRRVGVTRLRNAARTELSYVELVADATREANRVNRVVALLDALERYVAALSAGHPPYDVQMDIRITITDRVTRTVNELSPAERQGLIRRDLDKLEALAHDMTLPEITRQIVAELVANAPRVNFAHSLPGATLSREGVAEKYTVNHWLAQTGGATERVGSLAHELTHVSISEKFGNTALFLAFTPTASDDDIRALVATRNAATVALETLLNRDRTFNRDQTDLIASKIAYAKGNKLGLYAARFQDARKITRETGAAILRLAEFANNAVIEFDTVINQILVYMALWHIAPDNPFYVQVRAVAAEAYRHRHAPPAL